MELFQQEILTDTVCYKQGKLTLPEHLSLLLTPGDGRAMCLVVYDITFDVHVMYTTCSLYSLITALYMLQSLWVPLLIRKKGMLLI